MPFAAHRRTIAVLLLLLFLFQQSGCIYWNRFERRSSALPFLVRNRTMIYLVSHVGSKQAVWKIENAVLTTDSIKGQLVQLPEALSGRILDAHGGREARTERQKVLLHINEPIGPDAAGQMQQGASLAQITRIESFEVDGAKTAAVFVLSVALTFGLILLIIAALKTSCPFVYSHAPGQVRFEGEIFSGAIYPQLKRHDHLPLQYLEPIGSEYRITLANKAKEVQSTDLLELVTVDHAPGVTPLFDRHGTVHALGDAQTPRSAHDLDGTNIQDLLSLRDERAWMGDPMSQREQANDGMDLVFNRPHGAESGKLAIVARNSFWVDHLYMLFLDDQGSLAPAIDSINAALPAEELRAWARAQRLPLAVWLEQRPGQWKRVEQFEVAGPMAWRPDVVELDLREVEGDEVRLRLDCGFLFWEVDQVLMDFAPDTGLAVQALRPLSAIDQHGKDVLDLIAHEDDRNYVQPEVDDAAMITFPVPAPSHGMARSTFLHGAGHYRILHETVSAKPDLRHLKRFKEADALPRYSRERWLELNRTPMNAPL